MNVSPLLTPPRVVTLRVRSPNSAAEANVRVVVRLVALRTLTVPAATSLPDTLTPMAPATKFVPVIVMFTDVPVTPSEDEIELSVGAFGRRTENRAEPLVPPGVETVTVRSPTGASESIVNTVLRLPGSFTLTDPTVTPVPLIATSAPGMKFDPVNEIFTVVPTMPMLG